MRHGHQKTGGNFGASKLQIDFDGGGIWAKKIGPEPNPWSFIKNVQW
jgi:hypothetical protein